MFAQTHNSDVSNLLKEYFFVFFVAYELIRKRERRISNGMRMESALFHAVCVIRGRRIVHQLREWGCVIAMRVGIFECVCVFRTKICMKTPVYLGTLTKICPKKCGNRMSILMQLKRPYKTREQGRLCR